MKYITSSFSLQMIPDGGHLDIKMVSREEAKAFYSVSIPSPHSGHASDYVPPEAVFAVFRIGHEGTAKYFGKQVDRTPVSLQMGDRCLVAQPIGQRLQPGQEITAPDLSFFIISVLPRWQPIHTYLKGVITSGYEALEEEENEDKRNFIKNSIQPIEWLLE